MSDPEKLTPAQRDRELLLRNIVRMVGLFAFICGLGLVVISAADMVKSVVADQEVRYDWLFYVGLLVLIFGWWFLLAGYGKESKARYIDCQACGAPNDVDAAHCRRCDAVIT